jgi:hypothetical protein
MLLAAVTASAAAGDDFLLPAGSGVIDVTKPPYNARGDGKTDDTAALQKAYESTGLIYLPAGTYLISDSIVAPPRKGSAPCRRIVQGQSAAKTIIRLKDGADGFSDKNKPKPMLKVSWGVAQAFRNGVRDVTFDAGRDNAGAVGVEFFGSNQAGMHHVAIRSGDGKGAAGLSMTGDNGPMLINDLEVLGFDVGVVAKANQSVTMEHLRLKGQNIVGIDVGNKTFIRDLQSENKGSAVRASGQELVLLEAVCRRTATSPDPAHPRSEVLREAVGNGGAAGAAVEARGMTFIRDLRTEGYANAIVAKGGEVAGPNVQEWTSSPPTSLFPSPQRSLNLPVKNTPQVPLGDLKQWAEATAGHEPAKGPVDVTDSFQKAVDSGAHTIWFRKGSWAFGEIHVRGNVSRIIGLEADIPANKLSPKIVVDDGVAPVVVIERFDTIYGKVAFEHASKRTLVLSSLAAESIVKKPGSGDLFIEDVVTFPLDIEGGNVWARQLNMEHSYDPAAEPQPRPNVYNNGGMFWLFGLKTEQNRTKVITRQGGKSEVWAYILANRAENPQPMFVVENASMSLTVAESVGRQAPFDVVVREVRGSETRDFSNKQKPNGISVPLLVAAPAATSAPASRPREAQE